MRILVTGGTGLLGEGLLPALRAAGHHVRLLARGADHDVRGWPDGVEPFAADIVHAQAIRGCAEGCEAVIHVAGVVRDPSPHTTLDEVNVEGTRHLVAEAEGAGVDRFVYVSSLGADRGSSRYQQSKREAEELVAAFPRRWVIVRAGGVYGPGDETVSMLLRMVRRLPFVPVVDLGGQRFQPLWYEDFGRALTALLERRDLDRQTVELAGPEVTTTRDLLQRLAAITARPAVPVPMPSLALMPITRIAEALDLPFPLDEGRLSMLLEENVISPGQRNALELLAVPATSLDDGLRELGERIPEQLPESDRPLQEKRFWADIERSRYGPRELLAELAARFGELSPIAFDAGGVPCTSLEMGQTLTAAIPGAGQIAVRVEAIGEDCITLATTQGHFLAGVVSFRTSRVADSVRFRVEIFAQAAGLLDGMAMAVAGERRQAHTWRELVEAVVRMSGGTAPAGVREWAKPVPQEEVGPLRRWMDELVLSRLRDQRSGSAQDPS